jgi:hypothetical protein
LRQGRLKNQQEYHSKLAGWTAASALGERHQIERNSPYLKNDNLTFNNINNRNDG